MTGVIASVSCSPAHTFSKPSQARLTLLAGLGVEGDAHAGVTVKHRSRVERDPSQPNLRQVHLLPSELFDELRADGYALAPGDLGENITTSGLDLLRLPTGTRLHLGETAIVEVTGLRNPCKQIEAFRRGLLAAVVDRDANGDVIRKTGVMSIVIVGGEVRPGDVIRVELPPPPHAVLQVV
jgi:MOSC domain-containing protein YiiM